MQNNIINSELLNKFEEQAKSNNRLWNTNKSTACFLYLVVKALKPNYILELGTSNGFSAAYLLQAIEENKIGKLISIDADWNRLSLAKANLQYFNSDTYSLLFGKIEFILPKLELIFDLIYVDANKQQYLDYLLLMKDNNLINEESIIIFDNISSHNIDIEKNIEAMGFDFGTLEIGDGILICKKI